jgi:hypothetical protein
MYGDHYEIEGPFDSFQDLGAFGERRQEENADDDWCSIYLSHPHAPPCVIRPNTASCAPLMPDGEPDELCYLDKIIKRLQDYRDVVAARRGKGGPACA